MDEDTIHERYVSGGGGGGGGVVGRGGRGERNGIHDNFKQPIYDFVDVLGC